jgi:hypothetical protein
MLDIEINFKMLCSRPCFTPVSLTSFTFNAPSQFTPLLNLPPVILAVTPCGYLHLSKHFLFQYNF